MSNHTHNDSTPAYYVWHEDSLDGFYKSYCTTCDGFLGNEF